jgi:Zn-dependent M28 family amino/carboxypeptidase
MRRRFLRVALCALLLTSGASAQAPQTRLNLTVKQFVDAISDERIAATLKKLESFGTRHTMSSQDNPSRGIGAAKRWIYDEFLSYSPRLQVSYQNFLIKKGGNAVRDVELSNVIAVLPGTIDKDRYVLVTAHYDSINIVRKSKPSDEEWVADLVKRDMNESEAKRYIQFFPTSEALPEADTEATAAQLLAPGVTDDGSGIAAVLELARVMSQHQFDKTLVFIAFSSEEGSHAGSKAYAAYAKKNGMQIEAVLNNDIIGSEVMGNGGSANGVLRVFAAGPEDSQDRAVLRYTKEIAERYVPSMHVEMVFHLDRFGRGGDHMSFVDEGYPAVRLTTPSENFSHQHSATDTFINASVPYTTRVVRMNAAVAASLALAPAPPLVNWTFASGRRKGQRVPMLSRGNSGYDAVLRWERSAASDLAGYAVVIRATTSPTWEREIWVGDVTSYTMQDFSIDNVVLGVKAVGRDGNQSLVSAYLEPPYQGAAAQ